MGSESTKISKNTRSFLGLIMIIILGGAAVYYWLSNESANSFTIELISFKREYNIFLGLLSVDMEIKISHGGNFDCTLSTRELTLYLNNINCGTKGFSEAWDRCPPNSWSTYTIKWNIINQEDIEKLTNIDSYNVVLKFKAQSKSGLVNTNIEKTYLGTWNL
jgi:hypothetical protein